MKEITEIDKNLAAEEVVYDGMTVYHVIEKPFTIYGLWEPQRGIFQRMPAEVGENEKVNSGVRHLYTNTAGGRIRFKTDATKITLRSVLPSLTKFNHMPLTGTSCFDLYVDGEYCGPFNPGAVGAPKNGQPLVTEATRAIPGQGMKEILIHFPLYNNVSDVHIALNEGSQVAETDGYAYQKPIVYYGSSITQGGCASHAGNAYQAILSRELRCDHINLGFSGSCLGEPVMAEYIAGLDMLAFVFDYDHNAPSVEHLEETHEAVFRCVREKQPDLPILLISAADGSHGIYHKRRKEVIRKTYENALQKGDKNVYYLDGDEIYREVGLGYCTVDTCHPNDLGFFYMAQAIGRKLRKAVGATE